MRKIYETQSKQHRTLKKEKKTKFRNSIVDIYEVKKGYTWAGFLWKFCDLGLVLRLAQSSEVHSYRHAHTKTKQNRSNNLAKK